MNLVRKVHKGKCWREKKRKNGDGRELSLRIFVWRKRRKKGWHSWDNNLVEWRSRIFDVHGWVVDFCIYVHYTNLVNINYRFVYFGIVVWLVVKICYERRCTHLHIAFRCIKELKLVSKRGKNQGIIEIWASKIGRTWRKGQKAIYL